MKTRLFFFMILPSVASAAMTVESLQCEYQRDPVGIATAKPRFSWTLRESDGSLRGQCQTGYRLRVAESVAALLNGEPLVWEQAIRGNAMHVIYHGRPLVPGTPYYWQVQALDKDGKETAWSAPARLVVARQSKAEWGRAKWLVEPFEGLQKKKDLTREARLALADAKAKDGWFCITNQGVSFKIENAKNCPRFRKRFDLPDQTIRYAFVSVCGLGFYELYLNGQKVNDHLQTSLNTDYTKRLLFDTIEVTRFLKAGRNTIGIWLAPGYSDDFSRFGWKWEKAKRTILNLHVVYANGETREIVTDGSWQATAQSPISYVSLYHGESYQATAEDERWSTDAGKSADWEPADEIPAPPVPLVPNPGVAVRVVEANPPVSITEPKPGVFVADFGQNRAGFTRLRAQGARNTKIQVRHSELLGPDGMIDPWTNVGARSLDQIILLGDAAGESYQPRFTYHGFRYAEITGYPGRPRAEDLLGCAVHADVARAATFRSSNPGLNQLFNAGIWSMLSNLQGIPTDCCMRPERTPCQMDSQAYEDAALACFNMKPFYLKWLGDIAGGTGNPDWNGDAVTLPWRLYQDTGDLRFLADHYTNMAKVTDAVTAECPDGIHTRGFGDWCPPNKGGAQWWEEAHGHPALVNTAIYAAMADIMAASARLLGNEADQRKYTALSAKVRAAFQAKYFHHETGAYDDGSQTAQILPLAFGLVPATERRAVAARLVQTIREKNRCRLDTGIFGTRYLTDVLCDCQEADLAVTLLTQPDYPGFGFEFAKGATTLWEQWHEKGEMCSHNHAMFSGVISSLITRLGGIRSDEPGYRVIGICPSFPSAVSEIEVSRKTPIGTVVCRWKRCGLSYCIEISVPVNGVARLALPGTWRNLTENGLPIAQAPGVRSAGEKEGRHQFTLVAGNYHFQGGVQ